MSTLWVCHSRWFLGAMIWTALRCCALPPWWMKTSETMAKSKDFLSLSSSFRNLSIPTKNGLSPHGAWDDKTVVFDWVEKNGAWRQMDFWEHSRETRCSMTSSHKSIVAHIGFVIMGSEASLFLAFTAVTYTLGTRMRSGTSENRLWGKVLKLGCYTRGNGMSYLVNKVLQKTSQAWLHLLQQFKGTFSKAEMNVLSAPSPQIQ